MIHKMNRYVKYANKEIKIAKNESDTELKQLTGPILTAVWSASWMPSAIAFMPNFALARLFARSLKVCLSATVRPIIVSSVFAHSSGSGRTSQPVRDSGGSATILSVGPPLSQASTGRPHAIASTGPMPKCSFAGV